MLIGEKRKTTNNGECDNDDNGDNDVIEMIVNVIVMLVSFLTLTIVCDVRDECHV